MLFGIYLRYSIMNHTNHPANTPQMRTAIFEQQWREHLGHEVSLFALLSMLYFKIMKNYLSSYNTFPRIMDRGS